MQKLISRAKMLVIMALFPLVGAWGAECPSLLKNALLPVTEGSPLSWATELTLKAGQHQYEGTNDAFNSEMILGALEFKPAKEHRIYLEGGAKFWDRNDTKEFGSSTNAASGGRQQGSGSDDQHYGFREFFYEWSPSGQLLKLGLQEMTAGDQLLLDERVLGGYGGYNINAFRAYAGVGTVSRDFSRMGNFCGSRHMYQPLDYYYRDEISKDLFKNNLAFITFAWRPGKNTGGDSDDDFAPIADPQAVYYTLDEIGVTALEQFGSGFSNNATYASIFVRNTLPFQTTLGLEAIAQFENSTTRPAYSIKAAKSFDWDTIGLTALNGGYIAAPGNDAEMRFAPQFANLFIGEALKLDAVDAPLYYGSIFHTVPFAWPVYGGVTYVSQTEDDKANELDVEIGMSPRPGWMLAGIPILEHTTLRVIYSTVEANGLDGRLNAWRAEIRWAL